MKKKVRYIAIILVVMMLATACNGAPASNTSFAKGTLAVSDLTTESAQQRKTDEAGASEPQTVPRDPEVKPSETHLEEDPEKEQVDEGAVSTEQEQETKPAATRPANEKSNVQGSTETPATEIPTMEVPPETETVTESLISEADETSSSIPVTDAPASLNDETLSGSDAAAPAETKEAFGHLDGVVCIEMGSSFGREWDNKVEILRSVEEIQTLLGDRTEVTIDESVCDPEAKRYFMHQELDAFLKRYEKHSFTEEPVSAFVLYMGSSQVIKYRGAAGDDSTFMVRIDTPDPKGNDMIVYWLFLVPVSAEEAKGLDHVEFLFNK